MNCGFGSERQSRLRRGGPVSGIGLLAVLLGCNQDPARPEPTQASRRSGLATHPPAGVPGEEAPRPEFPPPALLDRARGLIADYQAALKQALTAALQRGDPASAVTVCRETAPLLSHQVVGQGELRGWTIGRTSHRVRNGANRPGDWQKRGLDALAGRSAAGALESAEWYEVEGGQLRYMKAIGLGPMCVTCHGPKESLAAPLRARLDELYPTDEATGYSVGELRGAFFVTAPLAPRE